MSNKTSSWLKSLQTRSSLAILITAAVLLEGTAAIQYIFARNGIRNEVRQRARTELQVRNLEIQNVVSDVETAVNNLQWLLDWAVSHPDSIYSTLQLIITPLTPGS